MYKVYSAGNLIHDDRLDYLKIINAKLTLEIGKTGLFEFTIYPNNAHYDSVVAMKAIIEVYRNDEIIFRGRALNIKYGFHNEKQVACEGELAFLLDSIIEPHAVADSFSAYLRYIVNIHNYQVEPEKQFTAGRMTVPDFYPFEVIEDYNFVTSLETLNKRMVEPSGGYLQVRHENGIMYLDLLEPEVEFGNMSGQKITLGKNLVDIKRDVEGSEVFSGIIPLGAKIEGSERRVNISFVNGGSYAIVNNEAVAAYGKIFKTVIFEDITDATALLAEATYWLANNYAAINNIEITAADLSGINPELDTFKIGQWVTVESNKHFSETQYFWVRKMVINLSNPADTKIEMGRSQRGLTDRLGNVLNGFDTVSDGLKKANENINSLSVNADSQKTLTDELVERVETLEAATERGTTGIWNWAKYSDGTAEFFAKIPVTSLSITGTLGSWYRSETLYGSTDYVYPFSFSEAPAVNITFQTRNGSSALPWIFSPDAATAQRYLPQCYLIRPTSGSGISGNLNIIGRGKLA